MTALEVTEDVWGLLDDMASVLDSLRRNHMEEYTEHNARVVEIIDALLDRRDELVSDRSKDQRA